VPGAVALLHPGAMGARVGAELVAAGREVRWLSVGRSAATAERAEREGLRRTTRPSELVDGADLVLSVCPPQAAVDIARLVAGTGFAGTYVDANPVSPGVLGEVETAVSAGGATFVDAGIVGPPPVAGRRTNLYLSGPPPAVRTVMDAFAGTAVTPLHLGDRVGAATAAKQAYALFNKGRLALAHVAGEIAAAYGVTGTLSAEAGRPGADPLADPAALGGDLREVAWRWAPELEETAATLRAAGMDPAPAQAVASVFARLAAE
jgi:3-hydroxyisobutyrate dehydrogenase-like beta-hydroxyacid dehydrogenase